MGRMLEALKRVEEPKHIPTSVATPVLPEVTAEEPVDEEMPFVEVGGPRKAADPAPRLEMPAPRAASLRVRSPLGVVFQPSLPAAPPKPRVAADLVAFHQPDHSVSQQYAALFAQLPLELVDDAAPAFLFTSLAAGAGTTTSLLNLAIAGCSKHAKRIAVVDANLDRPAAAARLGVTAAAGLHDVLQGKIALEQAILPTPVKDLHVLPTGHAADAGNISVDAFRWVLAWLRKRFDLVLIDTAAWDSGAHPRILAPAATAVYLVVDATETEQPAVRAVTRDVARLGSRVGGLIVTQ